MRSDHGWRRRLAYVVTGATLGTLTASLGVLAEEDPYPSIWASIKDNPEVIPIMSVVGLGCSLRGWKGWLCAALGVPVAVPVVSLLKHEPVPVEEDFVEGTVATIILGSAIWFSVKLMGWVLRRLTDR